MNQKHIQNRVRDIFKNSYNFEINADVLNAITEEIFIYHHELELQNIELLRMQKILEEKNIFLNKIFDEAPLPYLVLTGEGKITHLNDLAKNILRLNCSQYKDLSIEQFISKDDQDAFYFFKKQLIQSNGIFTKEIKFLTHPEKEIFLVNGKYFRYQNLESIHLILHHI